MVAVGGVRGAQCWSWRGRESVSLVVLLELFLRSNIMASTPKGMPYIGSVGATDITIDVIWLSLTVGSVQIGALKAKLRI